MRGFTLIEILVVVAIFGTLAALGLFMSMETFRGTLHRSEVSTVVSLLQKARSRAMNNIGQTPWGIYFDPSVHAYIIFRGDTYVPGAATNETTQGNPASTVTGLFRPGVVFAQLSGTTAATTTTVVQDNRNATISINNEGTIIW